MSTIERTIRRELRRSGVPVHASRRQARRLAVQVTVDAHMTALSSMMEAEIQHRAARLGGDLQAARAAQQGAAMGESLALGLLRFGRELSAGMNRLKAQLNGRAG